MMSTAQIINANARHIPLASESVQCAITSPPYFGLRSYLKDDDPLKNAEIGLGSLDEYIANMVVVFREVRRVLKPNGVLFLNLGDSYNGSGGAGGDYGPGGLKDGQPKYPGRRVAGLKPKDLIGVPWRVAFALQADGWWLRSEIIWCLSGGTTVYAKTQKGETPMTIKDMVRLDPSTVKLWNGEKWTQVLGWNEKTPRPDNTYEIELRSGERIGCTAGHLWPTQRGNVRADELKIGDVIHTCKLPEPKNPNMPNMIGEDAAWFVGLYIAEGSRSGNGIQIASNSNETKRFEKLRRIADEYGGSMYLYNGDGNSSTAVLSGPVLNGIIDQYVSGHTAKDKHLSSRCWAMDDNWLRWLLLGYLDGDGSYDAKNDRWRLGFTNNDNLAQDLRTITARLGYSLRLKRTVAKMGDSRFKAYRGQLKFSLSSHGNSKQDGEIIAIRKSRARKFWHIGVEDEPHLFALASGVLTHNSKPNPMPESATDRPTKAHEQIFLLTKAARYFYDADAIAEPAIHAGETRITTAKSFAGQAAGANVKPSGNAVIGSIVTVKPTRNRRSVWTISTSRYTGAHFATFPPQLIEPMVLAGSRPGDIVLDPFAGTATVGAVALKHHRNFIGLELNAEYIPLAEKRLSNIQPTLLGLS